jgi:sulfoquinovose isomerase
MTTGLGVSADVLAAECDRLLEFGRHCVHPRGGAAWLDERGRPDLSRPVFTWITARMTHVYCLGHLLGRSGDAELAAEGLSGLLGRLRDEQSGGWFTSIDDNGDTPDEKAGYTHAFVVLAASSARVVALTGADDLLEEALDVWQERFFDREARMFVDAWDRGFTRLDPYRGMNANMHAVEALLAAADATGDEGLRERALGIAGRMVHDFAEPQGWRIPEHFDPQWQPMLEHNGDRPDDPFQPYGATVGHGLEWSRLLLHLEASLGPQAPDWLLPAAVSLFDRAAGDGWAVDGADGFVYTTDWAGRPVVRDRMHWVVAEAIAAAAALRQRTGEGRYAKLAGSWWAYAEQYLIDRERGSWHHQLNPENEVIGTVWPGKPDLYHAVQATLLPRLPLAPGLAAALAAGPPAS